MSSVLKTCLQLGRSVVISNIRFAHPVRVYDAILAFPQPSIAGVRILVAADGRFPRYPLGTWVSVSGSLSGRLSIWVMVLFAEELASIYEPSFNWSYFKQPFYLFGRIVSKNSMIKDHITVLTSDAAPFNLILSIPIRTFKRKDYNQVDVGDWVSFRGVFHGFHTTNIQEVIPSIIPTDSYIFTSGRTGRPIACFRQPRALFLSPTPVPPIHADGRGPHHLSRRHSIWGLKAPPPEVKWDDSEFGSSDDYYDTEPSWDYVVTPLRCASAPPTLHPPIAPTESSSERGCERRLSMDTESEGTDERASTPPPLSEGTWGSFSRKDVLDHDPALVTPALDQSTADTFEGLMFYDS